MSTLQGKWAVVTGASSGIGREIACILAEKGMNVAVVARREDRLRETAGMLEKQYGVQGKVVALDLSKRESPVRLYDKIKELGITPEVVINNAGFGIRGSFAEIPWERHEEMINLELVNLTQITKLFLTDMLARKSGYILQVSSIGAYQPTPMYAVYAAAKAYVLNFGDALNYELCGTGVSCTVLAPGGTRTEFFDVAGQGQGFLMRLTSMSSHRVAELAVRAMLARRSTIIPGWRNFLTVFLNRLVPRRFARFMAEWTLRVPLSPAKG